MIIEKTSANYDIIDSGTIMPFNKESIVQLKLSFDETFGFAIQLKFENNENGESSVRKEVDEKNNEITIFCINFDNSFGTGTVTPIDLATYKGKKIYLHFWVYSLGDK